MSKVQILFACFPPLPKGDTVKGQNPAPPKKPRKDDSPVNTNKQRSPRVSKRCEGISSMHSTTKQTMLVIRGRTPGTWLGATRNEPRETTRTASALKLRGRMLNDFQLALLGQHEVPPLRFLLRIPSGEETPHFQGSSKDLHFATT